MKIQEVQFPLNIGSADELRVIIGGKTAYYSLEDTSQTSLLLDGSILPFKVLYTNKLVLDNDQVTEDKAIDLVISTLGVTLI